MSGAGDPSAPHTAVDAALCGLIGEILDIEDVTADEDFFELGGTSLTGALLIAQIERRLGRRVTLADLYEAPTAVGLGAKLRRDPSGTTDTFSVVSLPSTCASTTTAPVFLVHLIPAELARAIGSRRPVIGLSYGLAAAGDDTGWPPPVGVEALAAHYVAELRATRLDGPYHLAGYSKGAFIAWEMARQLREAGAPMGVLCLIDTRPPPGWGVQWRRVGWRTALSNIRSTPPRVLWLLVQRFALWQLIGVTDRLAKMPSMMSKTPQQRWARSDQPNRLGLIDLQSDLYRMRPLPGQPLLIECIRPPGLRSEPIPLASAYDSAGLTPNGHTLVQLAGDHRSIVMAPLAEQVATAIDDAIQAHETSGTDQD